MFNQLTRATDITVSEEKYTEWQDSYILDALRGVRYGDSFCATFGITDYLLRYTFRTPDQADPYIRKQYIAKS